MNLYEILADVFGLFYFDKMATSGPHKDMYEVDGHGRDQYHHGYGRRQGTWSSRSPQYYRDWELNPNQSDRSSSGGQIDGGRWGPQSYQLPPGYQPLSGNFPADYDAGVRTMGGELRSQNTLYQNLYQNPYANPAPDQILAGGGSFLDNNNMTSTPGKESNTADQDAREMRRTAAVTLATGVVKTAGTVTAPVVSAPVTTQAIQPQLPTSESQMHTVQSQMQNPSVFG